MIWATCCVQLNGLPIGGATLRAARLGVGNVHDVVIRHRFAARHVHVVIMHTTLMTYGYIHTDQDTYRMNAQCFGIGDEARADVTE